MAFRVVQNNLFFSTNKMKTHDYKTITKLANHKVTRKTYMNIAYWQFSDNLYLIRIDRTKMKDKISHGRPNIIGEQ